MTNKISFGQCYELNDHVYMVISKCCSRPKTWVVENTLTKERLGFSEELLLTLRRPFQNEG